MDRKSAGKPRNGETGTRSLAGAAAAAETIGVAWEVGGSVFGWVKKFFRKPTKKLLVFKIGDAAHPAGPKEISDFENHLKRVSEEGGNVLVTHHAVQIEAWEIDRDAPFKVVPWPELDDEGEELPGDPLSAFIQDAK